MLKKRFSWFIPLLALVFIIAGCGSKTETGADSGEQKDSGKKASEETFTLKAGHSLTEEHPYHIGLVGMAKNVEERTGGKVKIEVFPLSQLGAERELTEALTLGTADMSVSSTAPIVNFYPQIGILDLPFLFESREHAYKVLDGEIGQELLAGMEEIGIIGLAWGENGFRQITNSKHPITKPEDLKGIKIRTQENPIHLDAFNALGAKPTPMAWTEALTALQQGVVDAQENPIVVADTYKLFDANQKYMTLTGHLYSPAVIMFSKTIWDKLPTEYQTILSEEGKKTGDQIRELITKSDEDSLQVLKDQGMEIVEEVDVAPFREAIKPVYEKYESQFEKEKIDAILNAK